MSAMGEAISKGESRRIAAQSASVGVLALLALRIAFPVTLLGGIEVLLWWAGMLVCVLVCAAACVRGSLDPALSNGSRIAWSGALGFLALTILVLVLSNITPWRWDGWFSGAVIGNRFIDLWLLASLFGAAITLVLARHSGKAESPTGQRLDTPSSDA